MWDWNRLAEIARDGLAAEEARLLEERAVYGLDAKAETEFHPLLGRCFEGAGFGVIREQAYPSAVGMPGKRPGKSARDRCDLVLTPTPGVALLDPIEEHRERDWLAGEGTKEQTPSLFAGVASEPESNDAAGVSAGEAAWIEVKVVAQTAFTRGVPGPNAAYASELTGSLARDLEKLGREPLVRHGAAMLILFTQDERVAEHDVTTALHRCLDRGLALRSPAVARLAIQDRVGNALCSVVVVPASTQA